jgi:hypothetical protein
MLLDRYPVLEVPGAKEPLPETFDLHHRLAHHHGGQRTPENCVYVPIYLHQAFHQLFFTGHPGFVANRVTEILRNVRGIRDIRVDYKLYEEINRGIQPMPILQFADWYRSAIEQAWETFANGSPVEEIIENLNTWWVPPQSRLILC